MDEEKIAEKGAEPIMEIVQHLKELFPVDGGSDVRARDDSLSNVIFYLYQLGVVGIIAPTTSADDKDPDTVVVAITPPWSIGLPAKELYQDENVVGKYKGVISDVFGGLFPALSLDGVGEGVVEFEKKLAAAAPKEEDANDVTVSPVAVLFFVM
jgi:endothelin-converting enzyme